MALFKKVKDWLGIEGVNIALTVSDTFKIKDGKIEGTFSISSQSDQHIEQVVLTLKEKYSRGRRKSKLIDEYAIGEESYTIDEAILKDQVITKEFALGFKQLSSGIEKWGDKNIIYGGVVSVMKIMKNTKSTYTLTAEVSVKGNKLKPYDEVIVVAD